MIGAILIACWFCFAIGWLACAIFRVGNPDRDPQPFDSTERT